MCLQCRRTLFDPWVGKIPRRRDQLPTPVFLSVPCGSASKESTLGSIPGLGRSPGEGTGYPLQYSCLENPMDRGACGLQSTGSQSVGYDLVTKPPPPPSLIPRVKHPTSIQLGPRARRAGSPFLVFIGPERESQGGPPGHESWCFSYKSSHQMWVLPPP